MLEKGQEIECRVLSVDQDRRRIALGLKQLEEDPWMQRYSRPLPAGGTGQGNSVTKITNFGVFVGLEDGLEGLLHISELADHKVENPEEIVKVGDEIEVKILRVDTEDRKIGLSRKRVDWAEEDEASAAAEPEVDKSATATPPRDLKGGLGESGPLIKTDAGRRAGLSPLIFGWVKPAASLPLLRAAVLDIPLQFHKRSPAAERPLMRVDVLAVSFAGKPTSNLHRQAAHDSSSRSLRFPPRNPSPKPPSKLPSKPICGKSTRRPALGGRRARTRPTASARAIREPAIRWCEPTCDWSSTSPAATPARAWDCRT